MLHLIDEFQSYDFKLVELCGQKITSFDPNKNLVFKITLNEKIIQL